jgi:hypothetical protein
MYINICSDSFCLQHFTYFGSVAHKKVRWECVENLK